MGIYDVGKLISETRRLAAEYRKATGKALAVTSEIAKHDACELLTLEPVDADHEGGFDAISKNQDGETVHYQIKGRAIFDESKSGQRLGQLKLDKQWDAVVLVLMNEDFIAQEIYMASRDAVEADLEESSASRKKRGAMSVARFKHLGHLVWTESEGRIEAEIWTNHVDNL